MHLSLAHELMGSEIVLCRLVDRFYDLMDEDPDYFGIRKLHPQELSSSRQNWSCFCLGGQVARLYMLRSIASHGCVLAICLFLSVLLSAINACHA